MIPALKRWAIFGKESFHAITFSMKGGNLKPDDVHTLDSVVKAQL